MLLSIPYQYLNVKNVNLAPFKADKYKRMMARLSYKDDNILFNDVSILSPIITVIDYNPNNSRLRLDISNHFDFQIKLNTLYEYLINTIYINKTTFFNENMSYEEFIRTFYYITDGHILSLYIYPTAFVKKENSVFMRVADLKPGDTIRCIITFQGISQIKNNTRLRLHHSVPSIYYLE